MVGYRSASKKSAERRWLSRCSTPVVMLATSTVTSPWASSRWSGSPSTQPLKRSKRPRTVVTARCLALNPSRVWLGSITYLSAMAAPPTDSDGPGRADPEAPGRRGPRRGSGRARTAADPGRGRRHRLLQLHVGAGEDLDPFRLQLLGHSPQVDAQLVQLLQLTVGLGEVVVQGAAHLAVVDERLQGRLGQGVDGAGADQIVHVHGVGIARVLDRGAGPEAALRARPRRRQRPPTGAGVQVLEALVGQFGVGDPDRPPQRTQPLPLTRRGDLEPLVDESVHLGVDPADEEAGDAVHLVEIPAPASQFLQSRLEGLHHVLVAGHG